MVDIAVVGHGPSLEGKGLGKQIDEHIVIRMANNEWQLAKDYGRRYNYGLFCPPPLKQYFNKPDTAWIMYDPNDRDDGSLDKMINVSVDKFKFKPFLDLAVAFGGKSKDDRRFKLSRGCVAACYAMVMKPRKLFLFGLDSINLGEPSAQHYSAAAKADFIKANGKAPYPDISGGAHDFAIEKKVIEAVAERNNIKLEWIA